MFLVAACVFLIVASHHESHAASKLKTAPLPKWVSDIPIPKTNPAHEDAVKNGTYYRLASYQEKFDGKKRVWYGRFARKITNREGLEKNSSISISFRPELDEIRLHRVRIWRDGVATDLTKTAHFDFFQRETELEKGILDGGLTAHANLRNVKIGDTVEYAYSIAYQSVLMPSSYFRHFVQSYGSPTGVLEHRLILPKSLKIEFAHVNKRVPHKIAIDGSEKIITWVQHDPQQTPWEAEMPTWVERSQQVFVSSIPSWRDVAHDVASHYPSVSQLPADLLEKVAVIQEQVSDPAKQVAKVLALVQQEVRYVGIEIGRGAFVPRTPDVVWARGYGDCKDKTYLMVEILRRLGIRAEPALAHLTKGRSLDRKLPSPYAFDHVIVKVDIGDQSCWLDPTGTAQFDPDPIKSQADYGYVLPISTQSQGLTLIEPYVPDQPQTDVKETFYLQHVDHLPPLTLVVRAVYRGNDAARFRRDLAKRGRKDLADAYFKYYKDIYPGLEILNPLTVDDDTDSNVVVTREKYRIMKNGVPESLFKEFYLKGDTIKNKLTEAKIEDGQTRRFPLWMPEFLNVRHKVVVNNTGDLKTLFGLYEIIIGLEGK